MLILDYQSAAGAYEAEQRLSDIENGRNASNPVQVVEVIGYNSNLNTSQLRNALRLIPAPIEEFHYRMKWAISRRILDVLEKYHPDARLYYEMPLPFLDFDFDDPDENYDGPPGERPRYSAWERDIVGSTNLYSLKADITYGGSDNYHDLPLVYDTIVSAPNLRELELSIRHWGCVVGSYPRAFDFTKDKRPFPPLEVLKLDGYRMDSFDNGDYTRWASEINLWRHVVEVWDRQRRLFDFGPSWWRAEEPQNLKTWLTRMDWSKLRHLQLESVDSEVLELISPEIDALERLEIGYASGCTAAVFPTFLRNLTRPLEHLSMKNFRFDEYDDLMSAVGELGDKLSDFTLTEREGLRSYYCSEGDSSESSCPDGRGSYYLDRPYLNVSQIDRLAIQNPNITSLQTDVARVTPDVLDNSTWTIDHDSIRAAAKLPLLTHFQLNLESPDFPLVRAGMRSENRYSSARLTNYSHWDMSFRHDPSFNRTSVPAMFEELNAIREAHELSPLKELVIKVGRFEALNMDWGMGGPPDLLVGQWTCSEEGCIGGNAVFRSWHDRYGLKDQYSEDWTLQDEPSEYYYEDGPSLFIGTEEY